MQKAPAALIAPAGPIWPAAELDGSWDTSLAAWRYRRILAAIRKREAHCRAQLSHLRRADWDVVIDVPVPADWREYDGRTAIGLYGCVGRILSGNVDRRPNGEGTVLAAFPVLPLHRAVNSRLSEARGPRSKRRASVTTAA